MRIIDSIPSLVPRFWAKVIVTPEGCWKWKGSNSKGYGTLSTRHGKSNVKAHRVYWEIHFGEIPDGVDVLHSCDNPACNKPDHLFTGTHKENMEDAARKGRMKVPGKIHYGADNKSSKLNIETARIIRSEIGRASVVSLAERFKVSRRTIQNIRDNTIWKEQNGQLQ